MLTHPQAITNTVTGSTVPTIVEMIRMQQVIRVPLGTVSFPRIGSSQWFPTQSIDLWCYGFKMTGINASTIATKMIYLGACWHRAIAVFIGIFMCWNGMFLRGWTKGAISSRQRSSPYPTSAGEFHLFPKTLSGWACLSTHNIPTICGLHVNRMVM